MYILNFIIGFFLLPYLTIVYIIMKLCKCDMDGLDETFKILMTKSMLITSISFLITHLCWWYLINLYFSWQTQIIIIYWRVKYKLILLLSLALLPSCKVCEPVTKPVGTALFQAGASLAIASCTPLEKLESSEIPTLIKIPLYIPGYGILLVGYGVGTPIMFTGMIINPHVLDWMINFPRD